MYDPFPVNFIKIVVARNLLENSLLLLEADPFTENHSGELHHIRICLKGIKGLTQIHFPTNTA